MTFRNAAIIASIAFLLAGCVSSSYEATAPGTFKGSVVVLWVGEGSGQAGDGKFLFVPDPDEPLIFKRPDGEVIQPGLMYTDGGSIPPIGQLFNGFSPWGYAPAFMIHDWLFVARHCIVDGMPTPEHEKLRHVDFDDQSEIMAEAIKGLVESGKVKRNDFAGATITGAVDSVVARQKWDERGGCEEMHVTPKHLKEARRLMPRAGEEKIVSRQPDAPVMLTLELPRPARSAAMRSAAKVSTKGAARFVSRVSF